MKYIMNMSRGFRHLLITTVLLGLISEHKVKAQEPSWTNVFSNYYLSSVEVLPWGIVTGEYDTRLWLYPYNGIYISRDLGETWQKLGLEEKGITNLSYDDGSIYVTTYYHTDTPAGLYVSNDKGTSWEHRGPPYSADYVLAKDDLVLLGTTAHGLFVSQNKGTDWEQKIPGITVKTVDIESDLITVYAYTKTYQSSDNGNSWEEVAYQEGSKQEVYKNKTYTLNTFDIYENGVSTDLHKISQDITVSYTTPPYLYASINGDGIYKYEIPQIKLEKEPFLEIPWEYKSDNELIDRITAYFDHEYPLLGSSLQEPADTTNTTVNFLGIKEYPPTMYYSSHNGTDYALNYGTNIYAPAEGVARYFWCNTCGNSIEVDHLNGYKTTYMHLQNDVGISKTQPTAVTKKQYLGKVGMTGNTTGPHLHLTVKKGDVVVDPYGWQTSEYEDPWKEYYWQDTNGTNYGEQSKYLWQSALHSTEQLVNENERTTVSLDEKTLDFSEITVPIEYTLSLKNYINPNVADTPIYSSLQYVNNTSVLIEAFDLIGTKISNLPGRVKFSFDLGDFEVLPSMKKSLKIYYLDTLSNLWEPLETFVNEGGDELYTYITHFSQYAVFADTTYSSTNFIDTARVTQMRVTINY